MGVQVMDEGPFSDFGIEAEIIGFSLGTLVLVVLIGFFLYSLEDLSGLLFYQPWPRIFLER